MLRRIQPCAPTDPFMKDGDMDNMLGMMHKLLKNAQCMNGNCYCVMQFYLTSLFVIVKTPTI